VSVTAPSGFAASGIAAGLKSTGDLDVALVQNLGPLFSAAAVFTTNQCKANPVLWSQRAIADGVIAAVVLNSGGANCFTGARGFQTTHATAEVIATSLAISAADVLVCSTGLIGEQLDSALVTTGAARAAELLSDSAARGPMGGDAAATAILTTDSRAKQAVHRSPAGWTIGGMAKGAGMLAPGLATMLVVITTDAATTSSELDGALRRATRVTFERLDSDGCLSTNDTVSLLSSGASGIEPDGDEFLAGLVAVCFDLTKQLQSDAEGASHDIAIRVLGAASEQDSVDVARAVSRSALLKAAIFGNDPNWGRILAAAGTTSVVIDPSAVDVVINGVRVCRGGEIDEPRERVDLRPREVTIDIDLHAGVHAATVWTSDLTHSYVHENSAYSS
jgi:glutamate N-acetyltransferase/amino-acid N-acetyltransferase